MPVSEDQKRRIALQGSMWLVERIRKEIMADKVKSLSVFVMDNDPSVISEIVPKLGKPTADEKLMALERADFELMRLSRALESEHGRG